MSKGSRQFFFGPQGSSVDYFNQTAPVMVLEKVPVAADFSVTNSFDFGDNNNGAWLESDNTMISMVSGAQTSFSISCWMKPSSTATDEGMLGGAVNYTNWNTNFGVRFNGTGKTSLWIDNYIGSGNNTVANDTPSTSAWTHWVGVWDSSLSPSDTILSYVDGTLQTTNGDRSSTSDPFTTDFFVGKASGINTPSNKYYGGLVAEVSIWAGGLTSSNVTDLYNSGVPTNLTGHSFTATLEAWWSADDFTAGTANDKSGNGNDATRQQVGGDTDVTISTDVP